MAFKGQVLWSLLVMLAVLTELAVSSLQLAAQEGISVRLLEQRFQQDQRLQVMLQQLQQLPIPASSVSSESLWHPLSVGVRQSCGVQGDSFVTIRANCSPIEQPLLSVSRVPAAWQWRLQRTRDDLAVVEEGTDVAAFPSRQAQSWQLEVLDAGRTGVVSRGLWLRYQQLAP